MQIAPNAVVTVTYELHTSKDDGERSFVEKASPENALTFLYGVGGMIPKFETEIAGMNVGEKFDFSIAHLEAYGPNDTEAIVRIPIDVFKVDGEVDLEMLQIGNVLPMRDNDGNTLNGKVIAVDGESAVLDFNHPLAGQDLHFVGEIIEVREATSDELAHGHAHTDGMHHH